MTTVADYLIKQLNKLGIEEIFGLPGDFDFEIIEAIEKSPFVNWIGSTNELNAGYAADGYARIKGYGAIVTTYGVGELSAINAIAGSMAENVPVMKIAGVPATRFIENRTLLHHNLVSADYRAFYNAYSNVVETCAYLDKTNAKSEIDRIIKVMVKTKRPVYVAIPTDVATALIDDKDDASYNSALESVVETFKSVTETVKSDAETFGFEPLFKPLSDAKALNDAVDLIIEELNKSKNPAVLADILTKRFEAKEEANAFLAKTQIPSASFIRGLDIVNSNIKNYLGVYVGKSDNEICYNYLNTSDCIIALGTVVSDLNTMGFDFKFNLEENIVIQPDFVNVRGKKFENVLIKDVLSLLAKKTNYLYEKELKRTYKYAPSIIKDEPLSAKYIYPRINEFLKEGDILVSEVGLVPHGTVPMEFPLNVNILNQLMWGSIGWATGACEGAQAADRKRRTILITGDGAHQLTAQEISTMMRNNLKPIIFVVNNSGYTIERVLCDDIHYKYNDIASWDYSKLPCVFKGDCFVAQAKTDREFNEVLEKIEKEDRMCYIELFTDYLDIPKLTRAIAKHPEKFKK